MGRKGSKQTNKYNIMVACTLTCSLVNYIANNMDPDQTAHNNFKLEIFYQLPLIMDHSNMIKTLMMEGFICHKYGKWGCVALTHLAST